MSSARIPDDLTQYVIDLEDLVRFLALTYGDNDPILPFMNPRTGEPMPHNVRLAATWQYVVRGDQSWSIHPGEGPLCDCGSCSMMFHVDHQVGTILSTNNRGEIIQ